MQLIIVEQIIDSNLPIFYDFTKIPFAFLHKCLPRA